MIRLKTPSGSQSVLRGSATRSQGIRAYISVKGTLKFDVLLTIIPRTGDMFISHDR